MYLPEACHPRRVLLAVHGTERDFIACRDAFIELADETGCVVIAPLFPADIGGPDLDGYKYAFHRGLRYDLLLIALLEQVRETAGLLQAGVVIWGFSGGAQLAQRFALLHPGQVTALALAAPGRVTWLDQGTDWWAGIRNTTALFGRQVDVAAFTAMPVQVAVGDADRDPLPTLAFEPGTSTTRPERLARFVAHLRAFSMETELVIAPGVAHTMPALARTATPFLRRHLMTID